MDLSVKEITKLYPTLNESNIASEEVMARTKAIVNKLKTRFEERVIKTGGQILEYNILHI